jgi:DNA-binding LytR/AlgR family response regulator
VGFLRDAAEGYPFHRAPEIRSANGRRLCIWRATGNGSGADDLSLIELSRITHFFAQDKLTYAATAEGKYVIDRTIAELETELDPQKFIRIHRAVLLNADFVDEAHAWFGGRLVIRLRDSARTELTVARDRVRALKAILRF